MRLLWLLSLRLAATRADTCAAATARIPAENASLGTNETESAAAIRQRLSGRCRADRDEACENCYSSHMSTLCPFSLTARAAAVETGVELVLAPAVGQELRWVLPRHARPPWRLPQHAPLL